MSTTALLLLSAATLLLWLSPALVISACASFGPCLRAAERLRAALARSRAARSHA